MTFSNAHGRVILALSGPQPDAAHEVQWVLRDCLSGQILLVCSLLSASEADLVALLSEVRDTLEVPCAAVISDGQPSMRKTVARVFPDVPHQASFADIDEILFAFGREELRGRLGQQQLGSLHSFHIFP
jgi:hypothetical protein